MADQSECADKVKPVKWSIRTTVEIPIFIGLVGNAIIVTAIKNIILHRTCEHALNNSKEDCASFLSPIRTNETSALEQDVQEYASNVLTVLSMLEYLGSAILSTFIGVWSNTYGRRPLLIWPFLGLAVAACFAAAYTIDDSWGPWWSVVVYIPICLSGGNIVLMIGGYCYVIDTSEPKNTAIRMIILDATLLMSTIVGSFITSYLILAFGIVNALLFSAGLKLIAYAFTHFFIEESLPNAKKGGLTKVFNISYVKDVIVICFKKPWYRRAQIILICVLKFIIVVSLSGADVLEYFYTRQKLQWALQDYTFYTAASTAATFFGGFIGVMVVQKLFKLNDIPFVMMTLILLFAEFIIKMVATRTWHMYLALSISLFKKMFGPILRTHLRKIVPADDIVKVFAWMCTIQSVSPVLSPVIYNPLYAATLATFPGIIYLLSAILIMICIVILGFVYYFSKIGSKLDKECGISNETLDTTAEKV
ncbi:proton-coupled folate transporter-like [Aricia agestis]|uniref:proton-coupled folate transporter-like n=1 Tax=Aricia agestis TaxID=91739 RepID=UPI001C2063EE|nr:proton-coupled folate transporter-like [Aricia agestis]XP_041984973.1 proton-coupled folate transporter-like [Aricia agestis]